MNALDLLEETVRLTNGSLKDEAHLTGIKLQTLIQACLGLAGETGEVTDIVKKNLFQGHELNVDKLTLELGDVLYYVQLAALGLNIDLVDVITRNREKLAKRYPAIQNGEYGFSSDLSINRVD